MRLIFNKNFRSFCVQHVFQIDYESSPNLRRNISPILFRNIGSPYLRQENYYDESVEMFILKGCEDQALNYSTKMTQTEENGEMGYYCERNGINKCKSMDTSSVNPLATSTSETKNESSADLFITVI